MKIKLHFYIATLLLSASAFAQDLAKYKKEIFRPVTLGKHVIVGANSTILPGVSISEGCSVGAMSLVNKSTDPWGIYFGIPARRIKDRKKNILELEKSFLIERSDDSL